MSSVWAAVVGSDAFKEVGGMAGLTPDEAQLLPMFTTFSSGTVIQELRPEGLVYQDGPAHRPPFTKSFCRVDYGDYKAYPKP